MMILHTESLLPHNNACKEYFPIKISYEHNYN